MDETKINSKMLKKTILTQEDIIKQQMNSIMGVDLSEYGDLMQAKLHDLPGT
jgi:hypothetical protein